MKLRDDREMEARLWILAATHDVMMRVCGVVHACPNYGFGKVSIAHQLHANRGATHTNSSNCIQLRVYQASFVDLLN